MHGLDSKSRKDGKKMEAIKTAEKDGKILRVYADECPEDPRKQFDHLGKMACFHRRHMLGDETGKSMEDCILTENDPRVTSLPLYLLDHSGLSMRTGDFGDPWDSGRIGLIWIEAEDFKREFGRRTVGNIAKAVRLLKAEVAEYDAWLQGEVYGWAVADRTDGAEETEEDSCWGYYGWESLLAGLPEGWKREDLR